MQKYFNSVTNSRGDAILGARVAVTLANGLPATIYSDNGVTVQANPMTTDGNGFFAFYAADGRYNLRISGPGIPLVTITDLILEDDSETYPSYIELAAAAGADTPATGVTGGAMLVGGVTPIYVLKDFRAVGDTDSQVINKALRKIDASGFGGVLQFECGRAYTYDSSHSLGYINDLEIDLNGATLTRANSSVTCATLAVDLPTSGSPGVTMTLSSIPANWSIGDNVAAVVGTTNATMSNVRRITAIDRTLNRVSMNSVLDGFTGLPSFPAGTVIAKSFSCFVGRPSVADSLSLLTPGANRRVRIHGGTVDGNGANQVSNSWRFSTEVLLHSEGGAIYDMQFRNTTAECIVGHGLSIYANLFKDLAGSAMHMSVNDFLVAVATPTFFTMNVVRRVNLKGQAASGHSEGAITFSWGPGHLVVSSNLFEDGAESLLGAFGVSTGANPSRLLIVTNNIAKNFNSIFYNVQGNTYGVDIGNNDFHNCGDNSTLVSVLLAPANRIFNNTTSGSTVLYDSIAAGRLGPQVFEKPGGETAPRALNVGNRVWVRQSDAAGLDPSQQYQAGLVMESGGPNLIGFASVATQYAGIQYQLAGTASPVAYMTVEHVANKMILGMSRTGGAVTIKANTYQDHTTFKANGETVFHRGQAVILGDEATDGSWSFAIVGSDLVWRRRIGGAWVVKQTIAG